MYFMDSLTEAVGLDETLQYLRFSLETTKISTLSSSIVF